MLAVGRHFHSNEEAHNFTEPNEMMCVCDVRSRDFHFNVLRIFAVGTNMKSAFGFLRILRTLSTFRTKKFLELLALLAFLVGVSG